MRETLGTNVIEHVSSFLCRPANSVRAIVSAVLLLIAGGITRLHLIENRRELDSSNGEFLLPRWPGTIDKSDSLRPGSDFSFLHPVRKCRLHGIFPRDLIADHLSTRKC